MIYKCSFQNTFFFSFLNFHYNTYQAITKGVFISSSVLTKILNPTCVIGSSPKFIKVDIFGGRANIFQTIWCHTQILLIFQPKYFFAIFKPSPKFSPPQFFHDFSSNHASFRILEKNHFCYFGPHPISAHGHPIFPMILEKIILLISPPPNFFMILAHFFKNKHFQEFRNFFRPPPITFLHPPNFCS